jgi:hypothetical protein
MRKPARVVVVVLAISAAAAAGFVVGMEVANELALRRSLLQAAEDTWILERFRSIVGPYTAERDREWMELMIGAKEGILLRPEYRRRVEGDATIRNLKDRVQRLRQSRPVAAQRDSETRRSGSGP